ncbi:MAG: hypothetical protein ACK4UR_04325 [Caldimicrobium sp.]
MKAFLLIILFFIIHHNNSYSSKINFYNRELSFEKQKDLENLKKILVILALKKRYHQKIFNLDKEDKGQLNYVIKYKLVNSMYIALEKELKLKNQKRKPLKDSKSIELDSFSLNRIEELKENGCLDPITGKLILPGKHNAHLKENTTVKAPFEGIVKKISFKEDKITLILENDNCKAQLNGLNNVKVSLGEKVYALEPLGESNDPNFSYEIICK